jgi:hypothetical protein
MRITGGGNIGIGTTTPFIIAGVNLSLNNAGSSAVQLGIAGTRTGQFYADSGEVRISAVTSVPLRLMTADTEKVRITPSGDIYYQFAGNKRWGVDYDYTGAYFYGLATNSNARALRIVSVAADALEGIYFQTGACFDAATTKMTVTSAGCILIGTSTAYNNLTVLKNQNADTSTGIYNQTDGTASSTTLRLDNGSYNGQLNFYANSYTTSGTAVANTLRLYTDGPGGMSFSATNQHMRFYTSPNECLRMTILYGGSVGIGNASPKHNLDVCSVTTNAGGLAFCNMVTAQGVWSTFACVATDSNIVTTITYTNTIDYNRSGVFVARWAYNDTCAALYIRSCLWNDSQNINTFALRNNGGALQICLSGGGDSYRVQALIQGAKAT